MAITADQIEAATDLPAFDARVALNPPPLVAKIAANGGPPIAPREPIATESRYTLDERVGRSGTLTLPLISADSINLAVADFLPE